MVAISMIEPAPLALQIALALFTVVGVLLALHENGWLAYLRDRRVLALGVAVLVALGLTQTIYANTIYDLRIYCEYAWWDFWTC